MSADVVRAAGLAPMNDEVESAAVIFNVEPVADVGALAVNRQFLTGESIEDHQRYQLLRKLIGTVIIGAVGEGDRKTKCAMPGANQMIGGGLGGGVGAGRVVGCGL